VLLVYPVSCNNSKTKSLTEAQLRALEDEWMSDETEGPDDLPFKWRAGPNGEKHPPPPGGPKTEMGFVNLKSKDRKLTDRLASQWTDQLTSGGVQCRSYAIEDDKILFVCDSLGYKDMFKVKQFVLKQPQVTEFEWNQQKYQPKAPSETDEEAGDIDSNNPFAHLGIPNFPPQPKN